MMNCFLALFCGMICGSVFAYFKLPIPAPPQLPGILGIIGVYVGFKIINLLF
jgi:XapX domain-containing protein